MFSKEDPVKLRRKLSEYFSIIFIGDQHLTRHYRTKFYFFLHIWTRIFFSSNKERHNRVTQRNTKMTLNTSKFISLFIFLLDFYYTWMNIKIYEVGTWVCVCWLWSHEIMSKSSGGNDCTHNTCTLCITYFYVTLSL